MFSQPSGSKELGCDRGYGGVSGRDCSGVGAKSYGDRFYNGGIRCKWVLC
ncbi:conserved hypothetical protein [Ricinus communis]|uniref:Uncharacterized protein n=1 Tax=Ricinus communis TaxID=3988 RepID=B9T6B4_RICCO|nr:conserved hypothetical protein [Ricinus communis]